MSDDNKECMIQIRATKRERAMLLEVAQHRDLTMSQVIRHWIRDSHKRVEKAA